ncbi:tigger transposable element-derived protein 6 [Trichonephila clavipes]|nr:tigger transposable element-derived protein 6 [Trichonephila clavipes]
MDGSEKITPLVIGKSAKPWCLKGINSSLTKYLSNKKTWMTSELFNEWLVQLKSDMKRGKRDILLFLDNCTVHNNEPPLSNVKLQFSPRVEVELILTSHCSAKLLATPLILNHGHDVDDIILPTTPTGGRFSFDRFNVHRCPNGGSLVVKST